MASIKDRIEELIQKGESILNAEELNCIYGGRTICSMSADQLNALYKSWRKEFDVLIGEITADGKVNFVNNSAATEQSLLLWEREDGYYKIKEYWQQHIKELRGLLVSLE